MSIVCDKSTAAVVAAKNFRVQMLDPIDARRREIIGLDFELGRSSLHAVVGPSGSGKTTIALALAGLLPRSATVITSGLEIDSQRCWNPARVTPVTSDQFRNIVLGPQRELFYYVSQNARSSLVPTRNVEWHLHQALKRRRLSEESPSGAATSSQPQESVSSLTPQDILSRYFHGDQQRCRTLMKKRANELSTGECQRVLFAMSRLLRPQILIADEPFASLDRQTAFVLTEDLREFVVEGGSLMLVTHQLNLLRQLSDLGHASVVRNGEVIDSVPLPVLLDGGPLSFQSSRLMGSAVARPNGTETKIQLRSDDVSGSVPVLEIDNISKRLGSRQLFENQSFQVVHGSRLGIQGPSGGGKTTLARILLGLDSADSGHVRRFEQCGEPENARTLPTNPSQLWKRMQLAPQDADVVFDPNEIVGISVVAAIRNSDAGMDRDGAWQVAAELFETMGLAPRLLHAPPARLSGGERKRASIVRSLALLGYTGKQRTQEKEIPNDQAQRSILILDEPTVGLDVFHQGVLAQTLVSAQSRINATYVVLSHDDDFLNRFCDHRLMWPSATTV